jgi:futalosine hydrolase
MTSVGRDSKQSRDVDLVVCFATALEGDGLPRAIAGRSISLVRTGVGPVNAAHVLTRFLAGHSARAVVVCGIGGAYPGSGLEPGSVVCAESETYGDLGAESPLGFLDMQALGFPLVEDDPPLFNRLPLDLFPAERRAPFVTCATCTGTDATAATLVARTGGAVESMEGAAIVHVARLMGVPVGEVRGISNTVGARDRAKWGLEEAAAAARTSLVAWIEAGGW